MKGILLWATLGLVPSVPAIDGSPTIGCSRYDCCGCCETGACECAKCTCTCCVDECPTAGVKAGRDGCCGA